MYLLKLPLGSKCQEDIDGDDVPPVVGQESLVGVDVPPKVAAGAEVPIESLDGVGVPPEIAT